MRRILRYSIALISLLVLLCGCTRSDQPDTKMNTITDMHIPVEDITDFYYTYENINYNAFYQRYRFYREDGAYMFHHETREKPEDYGWTTEEDITASGTFALSEQEWKDVMALLENGKVTKREDSLSDGSSGPWMYIYWKHDKSIYQKYAFSSGADRLAFENYCSALAERP